MSREHAALLELVPRDGTTLGNIAARTRLGWTEVAYAAARVALIAQGVVAQGRGHGGTLRRVMKVDALVAPVVQPPPIIQPVLRQPTTQSARSVAVILADLQQLEEEIHHAAASLRGLW